MDPDDLSRLAALISKHFGDGWGAKFQDAFDRCRQRFGAGKVP